MPGAPVSFTKADMTRLGHLFAVLAFAFALLTGAAGGALAQHGTRMDHHGGHHPPPHSAPLHGDSHKAALTLAVYCCPAAEAPAKHAVAVPVTLVDVSWHPRSEYLPNARAVAPEPPPPKTAL